jgi:Flp pilus assembly protein TadG
MNANKFTPQKSKAQAMVEFAIVLPILLMLLYGILEAGRLLFIYSSVVTASRQAVRYGSATGQGQVSSTVPRYQDCAGIRQAAQRVDYLNAFTDDDIVIKYDTGPGSTATEFCLGGVAMDTSFNPGTNNSRRLLVTIDGDYLPIVPRIVGFLERSDSKSNPITAQSARTILVSVAIQVTAPPSTYTPSTPTWTPSPIVTPTFTPSNTPTQTASLTPEVSNTPSLTPSVTLSPTVTLTRTPSLTPSATSTRVPSCNSSHGNITLSGSTMTMTITNPNAFPLTVADLFVVWNHDKGHSVGNDKTLQLVSAQLLPNPTPFWTGSSAGPSATIDPPAPVTIPANGTFTIVFTFNQEYDRPDGSEEILINLSNPGCEGYPIHAKN